MTDAEKIATLKSMVSELNRVRRFGGRLRLSTDSPTMESLREEFAKLSERSEQQGAGERRGA